VKIFYKILGCKMNFLEAEKIAKNLKSSGVSVTQDIQEADAIIVNTCAVTRQAEKKSRQAIRSLASKNKKAQIIAFGCGIKASPEVFNSIPEIHKVFPEWSDVVAHIQKSGDQKPKQEGSNFEHFRTRAYIEIQNGCDNYCTYCITARLRGQHVSRPAEEIIQDIQEAEKNGIKEIVLTGINVGAWGAKNSTQSEDAKLDQLLRVILAETSIPRLRISSLGPQYLSDQLIELWASESRILPHLHLSLQSGSSSVLERMRRGYTSAEVDGKLSKLRQVIPDIGIAADVIVGFCGESDEEFQETCDLVQKHEFMKIHVFPFSLRQGTSAEKLGDDISPEIKKARTEKLRRISNKLYKNFVQKNLGKIQKVLVEATKGEGLKGLTGNYIQIEFPDQKELINKIVNVKIGESSKTPVTATKQLYPSASLQ
jgi:threonylcarbamoyladenosine tRNA methylthiotransferase MtaB